MLIEWEKAETWYPYYYGTTCSKFSVQIGLSTEPNGHYAWLIFHEASLFCQWSGTEPSVEAAKAAAAHWLSENTETWSVTMPKGNVPLAQQEAQADGPASGGAAE